MKIARTHFFNYVYVTVASVGGKRSSEAVVRWYGVAVHDDKIGHRRVHLYETLDGSKRFWGAANPPSPAQTITRHTGYPTEHLTSSVVYNEAVGPDKEV